MAMCGTPIRDGVMIRPHPTTSGKCLKYRFDVIIVRICYGLLRVVGISGGKCPTARWSGRREGHVWYGKCRFSSSRTRTGYVPPNLYFMCLCSVRLMAVSLAETGTCLVDLWWVLHGLRIATLSTTPSPRQGIWKTAVS